ncbi:MAG: serine/threonine protein kinase [Actinomycetota bacterium]|nr:serine/threonine protein kinase [Actinomycetota bacterium]
MSSQQAERLIASRYSLEEPLGSGGMGTVWRATDTLLQRPVAVKEVQVPVTVPEGERALTRSRVLREARAAARISHPGAVTVFDVVEEDGRPYIVMELVAAPTLEEVVRRDGPLDETRAARIGLEVLGALEAAHAQGIVHRDVKPGNVMLPPGGHAKLADFGIASVKGDPKLTATGLVLGSPSYMAPEQAREDVTGPASDLWSLGATLYFAVEGVPPFDRGGAIPTLTAVVGDEPRPPERARALRPALDALLAKDPSRRPGAEALRRMLEAAGGDGAVQATTAVAPPPVTSPEMPAAEPEAALAPAAPPRRVSRVGLGVVAAVGALLVAAAFLMTSLAGDDPSDRARGDRSGAPRGATAAPEAAGAAVDTDGWETYEHPEAHYELAYPPEWTVEPVDDTAIDFRDPEAGTYLRIDWTRTPGDDAVAAWEAASESFGADHAAYDEIRIDEATFRGHPAAEWEYTYSEGGADLHAINVGIVTEEYGYAFNFQTHEEDWAESQALLEALKESFVPGA